GEASDAVGGLLSADGAGLLSANGAGFSGFAAGLRLAMGSASATAFAVDAVPAASAVRPAGDSVAATDSTGVVGAAFAADFDAAADFAFATRFDLPGDFAFAVGLLFAAAVATTEPGTAASAGTPAACVDSATTSGSTTSGSTMSAS